MVAPKEPEEVGDSPIKPPAHLSAPGAPKGIRFSLSHPTLPITSSNLLSSIGFPFYLGPPALHALAVLASPYRSGGLGPLPLACGPRGHLARNSVYPQRQQNKPHSPRCPQEVRSVGHGGTSERGVMRDFVASGQRYHSFICTNSCICAKN